MRVNTLVCSCAMLADLEGFVATGEMATPLIVGETPEILAAWTSTIAARTGWPATTAGWAILTDAARRAFEIKVLTCGAGVAIGAASLINPRERVFWAASRL